MYLYHQTTLQHFKKILKEEELKSSDQTGIINEGIGIYEKSPFIYFSVTPQINLREGGNDVILYFSSNALKNKTFYVSTVHTSEPHNVGEWNYGKKKNYKKKYNRGTSNIDTILESLYNDSQEHNAKSFQVNFSQVAIKKSLNLKHLCAIHFKVSNPSKAILNEIKKEYPNVHIIVT